MLKEAIQLFGFFILTLLGVVAPLLLILLSVSREGTQKLIKQYENAKNQSEQNIKKQLKELEDKKNSYVEDIEKSLKDLKVIKKNDENKLSFLNMKKQTISLFVPLLVAFLGVILSIIYINNIYIMSTFILISLGAFLYSIVIFWRVLSTIVEVRKLIDDDRRDTRSRIVELITLLVERGAQYFLKNVFVVINNIYIKDNNSEFTLFVNKKNELEIKFSNREEKMAKNVEIGFIFTPDFIIEKSKDYSIYSGQDIQVVRYNYSIVQANTLFILTSLIITPIKKSSFNIQIFIKAENIVSTYYNSKFQVIESQNH